jgi:hypothetical protein
MEHGVEHKEPLVWDLSDKDKSELLNFALRYVT